MEVSQLLWYSKININLIYLDLIFWDLGGEGKWRKKMI